MRDTPPITATPTPEPLLDRKTAVRYLSVAPATLAVWDCTKRYDLKPKTHQDWTVGALSAKRLGCVRSLFPQEVGE